MSDRPESPSLLARRAQLKLDRQRGLDPEAGTPPAPADVPEGAAGEPPPPAAAGEDALADLPAPEELGSGDDFSRYLIEGVSDELRKRALARLFHLPQYNITDGLNDYDDDYTKLEPLGDLPTYQKRRMERPAEPLPEPADTGAVPDETGAVAEAPGVEPPVEPEAAGDAAGPETEAGEREEYRSGEGDEPVEEP